MKRWLWMLLLALICAALLCPTALAEAGLVWEPFSHPVYTGGGAYPRMCQLADGTLLCGFDAGMGGPDVAIVIARSENGGATWSAPVIAAAKPGYDCANANLIQLESGEILLAYRAIGKGDNKDAMILCSVSRDNGVTWEYHSEVIRVKQPGGVWEPHFIMIDGKVAVFYSNDAKLTMGGTGFQNIEFKLLEEDGWGKKRLASGGNITRSRDGMPVVDRLSDGRYVLVVEANALPDYVMVIRMKISPDGLDWSAPLRTICTPDLRGAGKKAAAPYVAVLPGDVLAVSYQTDDEATANGDGVSVMEVIVSRDMGETWSEPFRPFAIPDGRCGVWNGLYLAGDTLFAMTSANFPQTGIYIRSAHWQEP